MGKHLLSRALLGLVIVVATNGYEVGKEYEYEYHGFMRYLVPNIGDQSSGMAFRSKVLMQEEICEKTSDVKIWLKIQDMEMAVVNDYDTDWSNWDTKEAFTYTKNEKLAAVLERPFMMEYTKKNGSWKFDEIQTPVGDPIWSINMKKGLASLGNVFIPEGNEHQYKSMESSPYGECMTYWDIQHHPHYLHPEVKVFNITRAVNHEQCTHVASKMYGQLNANPCVKCESVNTHPLQSTSRVKYGLTSADGGRENMIIESADGFSVITHAPYTENGNVVKLNVHQHLILHSTKDAPEKMKMDGDAEVHKNLNMMFNRDNRFKRTVDMKKANDYTEDYDLSYQEDIVVSKFKELADMEMDEENQIGLFERKDPAQIFSDIFDQMVIMNYEQTEKLFNDLVKPADDTKKAKMQSTFVDIVTAAGHNSGIMFIMDKFKSGEIDTRFMGNFLTSLHKSMKEPTETALNHVWDFCQSDMMKAFKKEKMQCMLTYTALIDETCRIAMFAPQYADEECMGQKLQNEVFQKVIPEFEVAKKEPKFNMGSYIHMATNLKTHKSAEFMESVLHDKDMDHFMHMDAMRGLVVMAPAHKEHILKIAMEYFLNPDHPYDLRIMASVVVMKSHPSLSLLDEMAMSLRKEKSDQLKTYVVSMFKEIDQNDHPCFRDLAQHIRYIAPKLQHMLPKEWYQKDKLTSHMHLSAGYDPKFDFGGHTMTSMIMSPNSYLPRELYIGMGDYFANFFYDNFGITIRQTGMDKLMDHFNSPRVKGTTMGRNLWNYFGRRRVARDATQAKQETDEIDSKLNIKTKEYEEMKLEIILQGFGHDLKIFMMNESHFQGFMSPEYKPGTLLNNLLSADKDKHRFMNFRDLTFLVPTEMGLPAMLDVKLPLVVSYKRKESSFNMEPTGNMHLKLNRRLMYDAHLIESFSVALPFQKMYFGTYFDKRVGLNLPMNIDASANCATGKMQLNKDFLLPRDVVNYHFTPYTYIESMADPALNKDLPFYKEEELKKFNHDIMGDMTGVSMKISGSRLPNEALFQDWKRWYFESDMRQKFYYAVANPNWHPRKLQISVAPAATSPSTGRTIDMSYTLTEPEAAHPPSQFEEFAGDLPDSFVHVLNVESQINGEKERKAKMEMRYSFTPDRTQHWIQMFYDRTPFSSKQKDHTKMCMVSKVTMTPTDWEKCDKDNIKHINDNQKIDMKTDIHYGKNCKTAAEIHANVVYEHSDQQKEWLKELETGVMKSRVHGLKNPYMKLYKKCVEYMEKGLEFPIACHKFTVHTSQLNKMTMEIGFDENVKLDEHPLLSTIFARLRSRYYPHLREHYLRPGNETKGHIHIESTVSDACRDQRTANFKFDGPRHSSRWMGVPVSHGAHLAPRTATHLGQTNLMSYNKKFYHRYCDMQNNAMRTFDGALYEIPDTKCYSILAKDCSPHKLFTLMTANKEGGGKHMRLYLDGHKLDVTKKDGKMMMTLDGAEEELTKKAKVVKNDKGITLIVALSIEDTVIVKSNVYGIEIYFEDNSIYVQAAPFYRGKMCGLCGDFNLDKQHEMHTTDGCHHNTPWSYARNFVVPDATCTVPDADPMAGTPHCPK